MDKKISTYRIICVEQPLAIGENALLTVVNEDGRLLHIRTSPVEHYVMSPSGQLTVTTKNTIYKS